MAENIKEQIEQKAFELFSRYGIKSVSIDDICRELNISKKTFYVYYAQKTDLVEALLDGGVQHFMEKIKAVNAQQSILESLMNITQIFNALDDVRKIPPLLFDLRKYYPQLLATYIANIFAINKKALAHTLQKGMEDGLFRKDIDMEMCVLYIHKMYVNVLEHCEDKAQHALLKRETAFRLDVLLRGILSEEGMRQMSEIWDKKKK